ncbi:MAG: flagellar motor switch protein FliN, partial [Shinella sp.]
AFGGDFGSSDFGGGAASDFGADTSFGGSDFGGSDFGGGNDFSADLGEASKPGSALESNMDLIMNIPIDLQIVLGSSKMQVSSLMNLSEGATIALDRRIGEPVEVMVNGRVIGRGELTVLENDDTRFGVKLIEVKSTRKV